MEFAASLIAVVGLADQVISCCYRYISAVKDCPSDIRVLLVETSTLKSVVGNLEILHQTNPNPTLNQLFLGLGTDDGPIKGCRHCLAEIEKLLPDDKTTESHDGVGKKRRALQPTLERLAWPLRETKARKLVEELRRFRESISLALVVDISRISQRVDSKLQYLSDQLDKSSREKILEWLVATDPSSYHNTTRAVRERHTGLWLDKSPQYCDWKDQQGDSSLIWFYGIPGAGKTVLFSHIVEDIRHHCKSKYDEKQSICVYYYCYFGRNQDESTPLLRWILSQLARRVKYIPQDLRDLFDSGQQPDTGTMLRALQELSQRFSTVYILVDGLDESFNRSDIIRVVKTLNVEFTNIKILVMSLEEIDIRQAMNGMGAQAVSLSNSYVDEDIATYIRSELTQNPRLLVYPHWLKQEIEQGLVNGACGMFRWAACQIEVLSRLHTISDIRKALGDLPEGLDATYERILLSIPEEHKHRAKKALLLLSGGNLSFERPRVKDLAEAIVVDIDNLMFDPADRILKPKEFLAELCTSLVRIDETDPQNPRLLLAHHTVKEYLYSERIKNSNAGYFHSSDELAEYQTSMTSIVYLLNITYTDVPSVEEFLRATPLQKTQYTLTVDASFPLLEAATSAWMTSSGSDIQDATLQSKVDAALLRLFYPQNPTRQTSWIAWRALTIADDDWIHPVWQQSHSSLNPNIALSIACYFDQPSIVFTLLDKHPGILTSTPSSTSSQNRLTLDPAYATFWTTIYRNTPDTSEPDSPATQAQDYDIRQNPKDYLPSGTPLEVALRFDATECTRILIEHTPHIDQYTTPSGLSILSVALKASPNSVQSDFRLDHIELLLDAGASVNPHCVSETPLQSAALLMHVEAISVLLDAGALVNEVADDGAVISRIKTDCEDNSLSDEEREQLLKTRGVNGYCVRYKTPLRIVSEIMAIKGIEKSEAADLLRLHGGLDLCLFPVEGREGYDAGDWERIEKAKWFGVSGDKRGRGTRRGGSASGTVNWLRA